MCVCVSVCVCGFTAARIYWEDILEKVLDVLNMEQSYCSMSVYEKKERNRESIINHIHVPPIIPVLPYEIRFVVMYSKWV